jgi:AcrR family transcriptional regulator
MKAKRHAKSVPRTRKPRGLGHQRRGEILAAARRLFLKEGYENFTTRKLAAQVGLSQTGLYVYFKSKEELLDAVCRLTFERLILRFRAIASQSGNSTQLLGQLIEAYVEFGLENPDEYQLTFMSGRSAPKFTRRKDLSQPFEQQGIGVQAFLMFRDQVARMMADGVLEPGEVTLITQTIWSAAHGLVSLMIARPGYLLSEQSALVAATVDALVMGLRRKPSLTE